MALFSFTRYQRVAEKPESSRLTEDEDYHDDDYHEPGVIISWKKTALALLTTILIVVLSILAYNHYHPTTSSGSEKELSPCGQSHIEAKAAGCIYDFMMNSWLVPDCYDADLSAEFREFRDWPIYADKEGTQRLSIEELSERKEAHTTLEYHFQHCVFSLRKVHRAVTQGRLVEKKVAGDSHTQHCGGYLQRTVMQMNDITANYSLDHIGTKLHIGYPTCISAREMMP